jgi:hypothetical protein
VQALTFCTHRAFPSSKTPWLLSFHVKYIQPANNSGNMRWHWLSQVDVDLQLSSCHPKPRTPMTMLRHIARGLGRDCSSLCFSREICYVVKSSIWRSSKLCMEYKVFLRRTCSYPDRRQAFQQNGRRQVAEEGLVERNYKTRERLIHCDYCMCG